MIPTLRQQHEKKLIEKLEKLTEGHELVLENIETKDIDAIKDVLEELTTLFERYELDELDEIRKGIEQAYKNYLAILESNKVVRWFKLEGELKKASVFINCVLSFFDQLPSLIAAGLRSVSAMHDAQGDEQLKWLLRTGARSTMKRLLIKALNPKSTFGLAKIPYIDPATVADQILELRYNDVISLKDTLNQISNEKRKLNSRARATIDKFAGSRVPSISHSTEDDSNPEERSSDYAEPAPPPARDNEQEHIQPINVEEFKQIAAVSFLRSVKSAYPNRENSKLTNAEAVVRNQMIVQLYKELSKRGLVSK